MTVISIPNSKSADIKSQIRMLLAVSVPVGIDLAILFSTFFIDTFFLNSYSQVAAASVGALFSIYGLIGMILRQVAQAGAVILAQRTGLEDPHASSAAQSAAILNGLSLGLLAAMLSAAGSYFLPTTLGLIGDAAAAARAYMLGIAPGLVFLSLKYTLAGLGLAARNTKPQMYAAIVAVLVNVLLNWLILEIGLFGHDNAGAAFGVGIATAVAYVVNALMILRLGDINLRQIRAVEFPALKSALSAIWKKALPTTVEPAGIQVQWLIMTGFVASLGIESLAARIYVIDFQMFVLTWSLAIAIAVQVQTAHAVGSRNHLEANRAVALGNTLGALGAAVISTLMYLSSSSLVGLFTNNVEILAVAKVLFAIAIPTEIAKAVYNTSCWSLVSRGDHYFPVVASLFILFGVGVPLAWYLTGQGGFGISGIWIAWAVDEILRAIVMFLRWQHIKLRPID